MTKIFVSQNLSEKKVREEYQNYIKKVGNKDDKIDNKNEAEEAAILYSRYNPVSYQDFLSYLGKAGYASLHIRELAIETAVERGIWCIRNNEAEKGAFVLAQHAKNPDTSLELKAKMVEPLSEALINDNTGTRKEAVFASNALIKTDILSNDKAKLLDSHYIALRDSDAYVREWAAKNLSLLTIPAFAHLSQIQKINMTWHFLDRQDKETNLDVKKWIIRGLEVLAQSDIPQKFKNCINRNLKEVRR